PGGVGRNPRAWGSGPTLVFVTGLYPHPLFCQVVDMEGHGAWLPTRVTRAGEPSETGCIAMPLARVGPYEIVAEVGRGGAGTVFRARGPQGEVALKLLHHRGGAE